MWNVVVLLCALTVLQYVETQRQCDEDTLDKSIRIFISTSYRSEVRRTLQITNIHPDTIDIFTSCVSRYAVSEDTFAVNLAVMSFNIPGDYSSNSGDQGYTGRVDVTCRLGLGNWYFTKSNLEPLLMEPDGICTECMTGVQEPCKACLVYCESNEIPLDDCSGCEQKFKTQVVTHSRPVWAGRLPITDTPADTHRTNREFSGPHTTQLVGTTNVITHGGKHPDRENLTTLSGVETAVPVTPGYTTRVVHSIRGYTTRAVHSTKGYTTRAVHSTRGYTTRAVHSTRMAATQETTTPANQITTKAVNSTELQTLNTTSYGNVYSDLHFNFTGTFEVHGSSTSPTKPGTIATKPNPTTEAVLTSGNITTETLTEEVSRVPVDPTEEKSDDGSELDTGDTNQHTTSGDTNHVDNEAKVTAGPEPAPCTVPDYDCFNGGRMRCVNGDFVFCICSLEFHGTYCEMRRSVATVDEPREQGSFWDWKLSKYVIGALAAVTLVGLTMLSCMVVVKVREIQQGGKQTKTGELQRGGDGHVYTSCPSSHVKPTSRGQRLF